MTPDEHEAKDHLETFIIIDESDIGGNPPPDGRTDVASRTFDRMLDEVRDRCDVTSNALSVISALSVALMTMSAALLMFVLSEWTVVQSIPVIVLSILCLVFGIRVHRVVSVHAVGIQIHDIVFLYNHQNYELVNHLLFNIKSLVADGLEGSQIRASNLLGCQVMTFSFSLLIALVTEVVQ